MNDVEFITNEEQWPVYPFLPMVHRRREEHGLPKQGLLYARGQQRTVYEANLYDIPRFGGHLTESEFLAVQKHTYESIRALLEDWRID